MSMDAPQEVDGSPPVSRPLIEQDNLEASPPPDLPEPVPAPWDAVFSSTRSGVINGQNIATISILINTHDPPQSLERLEITDLDMALARTHETGLMTILWKLPHLNGLAVRDAEVILHACLRFREVIRIHGGLKRIHFTNAGEICANTIRSSQARLREIKVDNCNALLDWTAAIMGFNYTLEVLHLPVTSLDKLAESSLDDAFPHLYELRISPEFKLDQCAYLLLVHLFPNLCKLDIPSSNAVQFSIAQLEDFRQLNLANPPHERWSSLDSILGRVEAFYALGVDRLMVESADLQFNGDTNGRRMYQMVYRDCGVQNFTYTAKTPEDFGSLTELFRVMRLAFEGVFLNFRPVHQVTDMNIVSIINSLPIYLRSLRANYLIFGIQWPGERPDATDVILNLFDPDVLARELIRNNRTFGRVDICVNIDEFCVRYETWGEHWCAQEIDAEGEPVEGRPQRLIAPIHGL